LVFSFFDGGKQGLYFLLQLCLILLDGFTSNKGIPIGNGFNFGAVDKVVLKLHVFIVGKKLKNRGPISSQLRRLFTQHFCYNDVFHR
jgi:hypothetical protein